jgi:hypothetical protein
MQVCYINYHYVCIVTNKLGAIQLSLNVAESSDKANLALNWMMDGRQEEV